MDTEVVGGQAPEAVNAESAPANEFVAQDTAVNTTESATVDVEHDDSENIDSQGAKPSKVVEELKAQRKKRQDAEREAAYWRGMAEARAKEEKPTRQEVPSQPAYAQPVQPKLENFETFEQYEAAKDEYLLNLAEYRILQKQQEQAHRQEMLTKEQKFQRQINDAIASDPGFVDVMRDPTLPVSSTMIPILQESEIAPQVIQWLNNNRAEAARIASLGPVAAARELGIVEAQIRFTPKPEPPRKVSSAPEPVKVVTPVTPSSIDESDLPMEEYHRRRTQLMFGKR